MKPQDDGVITATVISTASHQVPSIMSEQENREAFQLSRAAHIARLSKFQCPKEN